MTSQALFYFTLYHHCSWGNTLNYTDNSTFGESKSVLSCIWGSKNTNQNLWHPLSFYKFFISIFSVFCHFCSRHGEALVKESNRAKYQKAASCETCYDFCLTVRAGRTLMTKHTKMWCPHSKLNTIARYKQRTHCTSVTSMRMTLKKQH